MSTTFSVIYTFAPLRFVNPTVDEIKNFWLDQLSGTDHLVTFSTRWQSGRGDPALLVTVNVEITDDLNESLELVSNSALIERIKYQIVTTEIVNHDESQSIYNQI